MDTLRQRQNDIEHDKAQSQEEEDKRREEEEQEHEDRRRKIEERARREWQNTPVPPPAPRRYKGLAQVAAAAEIRSTRGDWGASDWGTKRYDPEEETASSWNYIRAGIKSAADQAAELDDDSDPEVQEAIIKAKLMALQLSLAQAKIVKKRSASRPRAKTPGPDKRRVDFEVSEEVTGGASASGTAGSTWSDEDRAAWRQAWESDL